MTMTPLRAVAWAMTMLASFIATDRVSAVIVQGPADDYIAWEGETNVLINNSGGDKDWAVLPNGSASGGFVLENIGPNGGGGNPGETTAAYALQFSMPGTYAFYALIDAPDGGANSMYIPDQFNAATPASTFYNGANTSGFEWIEQGTFTVNAGDVGNTLNFILSGREGTAFKVDRMVMSLNTGLADSALDALANSNAPVPPPFETIAFDGFEGVGGEIGHTVNAPANGFAVEDTDNPFNGSQSLHIGLTAGPSTDVEVLSNPVDISSFFDVIVDVAWTAPSPNAFESNDNLLIEVLHNGTGGPIELLDINDGGLDPNSAFVIATGFLPDDATTAQVRIVATISEPVNEDIFIDDVLIRGRRIPVPEPAGATLLALGLAAMARRRRSA